MSRQAVYAALGVRGDEHRSIRLGEGSIIVRLTVKDEAVCCPGCGSGDVVRRGCEVREFRAPPIANRAARSPTGSTLCVAAGRCAARHM